MLNRQTYHTWMLLWAFKQWVLAVFSTPRSLKKSHCVSTLSFPQMVIYVFYLMLVCFTCLFFIFVIVSWDFFFFFLQNRVLFCSPGWHWFRQSALECRVIFLSQPSECWSDKNEPPFLATCIYLHYWHYFLKMNICFTFMQWEACLL